MWATNGLAGVSTSEVELKSQIQFYDGITTRSIQETMIKAAGPIALRQRLLYVVRA